MTSHDTVTRVKRILKAAKAGHAGTLDPMATGVLLVCINEATKISRFLLDLGKEYRAVLKLGERTNTFDADGEVIERKDMAVFAPGLLMEVLPRFRGKILQRPPMYSAVKINGRPLYKLARQGIEIDRPERAVVVSRLEVVRLDLPYLVLDIACSKGTYIRSLAEDIGNLLGTGAHLVSLQRTRVGSFRTEDAVSLSYIESGTFPFSTISEALGHLPYLEVDEAEAGKLRSGQQIEIRAADLLLDEEFFLVKGRLGDVVAIGTKKFNKIKAERVFNLPGVEPLSVPKMIKS